MFSLFLLLLNAAQAAAPPRVMLWTWETPADLRFLRPHQAGVAFLAGTFRLEGEHVRVRPRMNRLRVAPGVFLMATMRIETSKVKVPSYSGGQRRELSESVRDIVKATSVPAVQLDFDAPNQARAFYQALIPELRAQLGPRTFLSVTALASWCEAGDWLDRLGADEVVPMLFRMGPAGPAIRARLQESGHLAVPVCRSSVGLDPDEPGSTVMAKRYQRVYLFVDLRHWDAQGIERILKEVAPQ